MVTGLIITAVHEGDDVDVSSLTDMLLRHLEAHKFSFASHFKSLERLRYEDRASKYKYQGAVYNAADELSDKCTNLTDDEKLYHLLNSLHLSASSGHGSDRFKDPLRESLVRAFLHDYRGDAHHRFLNFVLEVNSALFRSQPEGKRPYYKGTAIVQSRGTGKTRMVLELGRIAPLLYMCYRPQTSTERTDYPPGDSPIIGLIERGFEANSRIKNKGLGDDERAAIVLAAWFGTLASRLEEFDGAKAKSNYLIELNSFGTEDQDTRRHLFFSAVRTQALELVKKRPTDKNTDALFSYYLDLPVHRLSRQIRIMQEHLATGSIETPRRTPVFVAIDECMMLPSELRDGICRAWIYIGELENSLREERQSARRQSVRVQSPSAINYDDDIVCFWLVLISNSSSAARLIRPQPFSSSAVYIPSVPLPTFVGVGFDVLRGDLPPLNRAEDAATVQHIQKYGRPFWISLVPQRFWSVASSKLLGTNAFVRACRLSCFSVLASRLALRYVPAHDSDYNRFHEQAYFASTAVHRHMRILDKVDSDAILHVHSPSEPVLAIAASLAMLPTPRKMANDMPVPLQKAVNRYGSILETVADSCLGSSDIDILKGMRGELIVRLLLMTAWDAAKFATERSRFPDAEELAEKAVRLLAPVELDTILQGLLHFDTSSRRMVHDRIEAICRQVRDRSPVQADVRAWTHYTHFDLLEIKVQELSPEYLWYCWKRGVAIQMTHPQHGIDGIIPVFVGDLKQGFVFSATPGVVDAEETRCSEAYAASQMTFIAWDANNRRETNAKLAGDAARKPEHAGPVLKHEQGESPALTRRGILTLLADVGARTGPGGIQPIQGTDSLQLWIRGTDSPNYPCLDVLEIRDVVTAFLGKVARRYDYEAFNRMPDPMDLDAPKTTANEIQRDSPPTLRPAEQEQHDAMPDDAMES